MSVKDVLLSLGSKRTIWIDDFFNDGPERLAAMLLGAPDVTRTCAFPEAAAALRTFEARPEASHERLVAALADAGEARMREMKDAFFKARRELGRSGPELSSDAVDHVCTLLGVEREDRWHFDQAFASLEAVCSGEGDATVNYVVDLNDTMGSRTRGLEILIYLAKLGSKGTAFILTHDAETVQEAAKELEFRRKIREDDPTLGRLTIPVCVIAKERLFGDPSATDIEDVLTVALKRAGLRRSVHEVLWKAEGSLAGAFQDAAERLAEIPPEQLERHVVERGYREGVSELHVVERALTSHMARTLREMFGVDEAVRRSAQRMRSLRKFEMGPAEALPDPNLAGFYNAEVWETGDLVNREFSPIACGDVFELDADEPGIGKTKRRYVLLGQPCDISIRPGQRRQQDTAFLICMKAKKEDKGPAKAKEPVLPFPVDGERWEFQFRTATVARLSILDLASYRQDGKVRVDLRHEQPDGLLDGLSLVYGARTAAADHAMAADIARRAAEEAAKLAAKAAAKAAAEAAEAAEAAQKVTTGEVIAEGSGGDAAEPAAAAAPVRPAAAASAAPVSTAPARPAAAKAPEPRMLIDPDLQLTFSNDEDFKYVNRGLCSLPQQGTKDGRVKEAPLRVTWRLRRCGRIRMPFAAALLEQYTAGMSRRAFDVDYMFVPPPRPDRDDLAEVPAQGPLGAAVPLATMEREAADHLRGVGFAPDRIEALFGYIPDPIEPADAAGEAGQPASEEETPAAR